MTKKISPGKGKTWEHFRQTLMFEIVWKSETGGNASLVFGNGRPRQWVGYHINMTAMKMSGVDYGLQKIIDRILCQTNSRFPTVVTCSLLCYTFYRDDV